MDLLEALRPEDGIDNGTIHFLLEALENDTADEWEPLLDPFIQDPSVLLQVLESSSDPVAVIGRAKDQWLRLDHPSSTSTTASAVDIGTESDHSRLPDAFWKNLSHTCIPGANNRAISLDQLRQIFNLYSKSG